MRNYLIILAIACLATGCRKNEDTSTVRNGPGHTQSTVLTEYSGAITACGNANCIQDVPTNATYSNIVIVYLCRNTSCTTAIPVQKCSEVPFDPTTPCSLAIPNPYIAIGDRIVRLTNAGQQNCISGWNYDPLTGLKTTCPGPLIPGYSSYFIQTYVNQ